MFAPWQMRHPGYPMPRPAYPMPRPVVMRMQVPLLEYPTGAFPVPQALQPEQFPPAVKESLMRLFEGPPKPAVTLAVMNQTQASMIAPDLPFKADV